MENSDLDYNAYVLKSNCGGGVILERYLIPYDQINPKQVKEWNVKMKL